MISFKHQDELIYFLQALKSRNPGETWHTTDKMCFVINNVQTLPRGFNKSKCYFVDENAVILYKYVPDMFNGEKNFVLYLEKRMAQSRLRTILAYKNVDSI
jgi:hypothetical protein